MKALCLFCKTLFEDTEEARPINKHVLYSSFANEHNEVFALCFPCLVNALKQLGFLIANNKKDNL